jgi:hypothetical protein
MITCSKSNCKQNRSKSVRKRKGELKKQRAAGGGPLLKADKSGEKQLLCLGFGIGFHFVVSLNFGVGFGFGRFNASGGHFVFDHDLIALLNLTGGFSVFIASDFPVFSAFLNDDGVIFDVNDGSRHLVILRLDQRHSAEKNDGDEHSDHGFHSASFGWGR